MILSLFVAGAVLYFVRLLRCGSAIFVPGAGNREVVSCGRGGCRCHIGIGV